MLNENINDQVVIAFLILMLVLCLTSIWLFILCTNDKIHTRHQRLNCIMKQLLNGIFLKTSRPRGFFAYGLLLLCAPAYHLLEKVSNDAGGPASRYLPLSVGLILMVGHYLYIRRKPLKCGLAWRIFLYAYWVGVSLLMLFIVYLVFTGGLKTVFPAIAGIVWTVITIPSAIAIARYINQYK